MRKKSLKKSKAASAKGPLIAGETPAAPSLAVGANANPVQVMTGGPNVAYSTEPMPMPPDLMLREADEEPNYSDLREYCPVIETLRNKGFSYREIANWLGERGLHVDHNAVYRVYINSLSRSEASMEAEQAEDEAREEGYLDR